MVPTEGGTENRMICQHCEIPLSDKQFFYTIARNSYMFGFFCCYDCASSSEYSKYLKPPTVLKIQATPESHKDLVVIPSIQTLKQYKEESERRELRKKYFS